MSRRVFARGDVINVTFLNPGNPALSGPIRKYVVVLQGGDYWRYHPALQVALVTSQPPVIDWPHMVKVEPAQFSFGGLVSWIDCGDLYRIGRDLLEAGDLIGSLNPDVLRAVDESLLVGVGIVDGETLLAN